MRQPVMTALLLIMCFPVKGVVVTIAAAAIGAAIPLPKAIAPAKPQREGSAGKSAPTGESTPARERRANRETKEAGE